MGALEAVHCIKDTVFISQHLLQSSIITSGLWLIQENLKGTVFVCLKKTIGALLL